MSRVARALARAVLAGAAVVTLVVAGTALAAGTAARPAAAQVPAPVAPTPPTPQAPEPGADGTGSSGLQVDLGGEQSASNSIIIILVLTVLAVAPSLLILTTGFTRIVIVLSIARNALGLPTIPPNQVVVGLALFLSLFVMAPTLQVMNEVGLQPLLSGEKTEQQALEDASVPLKGFMLDNTRVEELDLFIGLSGEERPAELDQLPLTTIVPAFVLSELKTAFIIGFVVFIPFLVIDLVVAAVLMSLGMMMLPPVFVSLPFKVLLFVMVGGWTLITESLVRSFN